MGDGKGDNNNITVSSSDNEQGFGDAPNGSKKFEGFNRQVDIHIHSRRNRLTDPDGGFSKYVVDALVTAGILQDDRQEEVRRVSHTQEKTNELEETIVTIREVE